MNTATGEIYKVLADEVEGEDGIRRKISELSQQQANFMKMIPEQFVAQMQGMNRKARREFYRQHKKEFKEASHDSENQGG